MKISIDFSVTTSSGEAIGNIEGKLTFKELPVIGDSVSFLFSPKGVIPKKSLGFLGVRKVVDRIFRPGAEHDFVTLILDDVVLETREQAIEAMEYFELGFDLCSNIYADGGD